MIIRKPYAFFIKHFRLFHFIFVLLAFNLIVSNISLFEFFNDYVSTNPTIVSSYIYELTRINIIWNIILILGLITVMGILIYKKKDIKLYILLILVYIFVTILYIISNNTLFDLTKYLVDIRIVKAIHDILFVTIFMQVIMLALLFTRATGFDIKKFDFARDYAMLNVSHEDREEVELSLEFDFNVFKARFNKFLRDLKCFYLENRLVSLSLIGIFIVIFSIYLFVYFKNNSYITVKGNINSSKYIIDIGDIFIDNVSYNGNVINDSNFVILNANIKVKGVKKSFNSSNLMLIIDNISYVPLKQYNQYFIDFGKPYNDDVIEDVDSYYFVYSIPSNVLLDNCRLVYSDVNKYYQMNVDFIDLRLDNDKGSYSIGDNIMISSSFMEDFNFKIDEVSFKNKFLVPYIYKNSGNYYTSSYYVSPSINGNYDKSVIRIVSDNCDFIEKYGYIYYDGFKSKVSLKKINSSKDNYCYYEGDYELLSASSVYLKLNVRGNIYKYYLK